MSWRNLVITPSIDSRPVLGTAVTQRHGKHVDEGSKVSEAIWTMAGRWSHDQGILFDAAFPVADNRGKWVDSVDEETGGVCRKNAVQMK